jgi:hypothetical protein
VWKEITVQKPETGVRDSGRGVRRDEYVKPLYTREYGTLTAMKKHSDAQTEGVPRESREIVHTPRTCC